MQCRAVNLPLCRRDAGHAQPQTALCRGLDIRNVQRTAQPDSTRVIQGISLDFWCLLSGQEFPGLGQGRWICWNQTVTWQELVQRHDIIQENKQVESTLNIKKSLPLHLCPKWVALISLEGELFSCWLSVQRHQQLRQWISCRRWNERSWGPACWKWIFKAMEMDLG